MEQEMNILLIEDDAIACDEIEQYIETVEDVSLCGTTNNSAVALEMVQSHLPDAVILDLELHLGGGNGFLFLMGLNQLELTIRPYILITTNNSSNITCERARELGADFILAKYESGYSAQYVIEFLRMMKDSIMKHSMASAKDMRRISPAQKEQKTKQHIQRELDLVGISPKAVGYQYLTEAIYITSQGTRTNLSKIIAEKFKKSDASVERAMQNAINKAWRTNDPDELLKYYKAHINLDRGVPTTLEFVYYYVNQLRYTH